MLLCGAGISAMAAWLAWHGAICSAMPLRQQLWPPSARRSGNNVAMQLAALSRTAFTGIFGMAVSIGAYIGIMLASSLHLAGKMRIMHHPYGL
jgi:hypothetical protein